MWVKKVAGAFVALLLAVSVVSVLTGPAEAAGKKPCKNIAHRAMYKHTENQVRGVKENARWGFSEIDARITADDKIVALHDFTMARPTGGRNNTPVGELTLRQIRNMKFTLGRRAETTRRLIKVSGNQNRPVMVTINSYKLYKSRWDGGGLESLWKAANAHPKRSRVYFGGPGGEKAMRAAFPKAATFHRYGPKDSILKDAVANGVDLAGIPPKRFSRKLVRRLQAAGIRVTTTQLNSKRAVRRANKVGIRLVQTDRSRRTVRRWCS